MKNKNLMWIILSIFIIVFIILGVYLNEKPTQFHINCKNYDVEYYRCDVISPLPISLKFGISATQMCSKKEMTSPEECAIWTFRNGDCNNFEYGSNAFMGIEEVSAYSKCKPTVQVNKELWG